MLFLGTRIPDPVSASILIMMPIMIGIAWLLRKISIVQSATACPGGAARSWKRWAVLLAPVGAILLLSSGLFSQRNTLAALRYLAPTAWSREAPSVNDILRKSAHLGEYGLLFLLAIAGPLRGRRSLALALLPCRCVGRRGPSVDNPSTDGLARRCRPGPRGRDDGELRRPRIGIDLPALGLKRGRSPLEPRHARQRAAE
jgi:hypothetical protein